MNLADSLSSLRYRVLDTRISYLIPLHWRAVRTVREWAGKWTSRSHWRMSPPTTTSLELVESEDDGISLSGDIEEAFDTIVIPVDSKRGNKNFIVGLTIAE